MEGPYQPRQPRAFISCSLRDQDAWFADWVIRLTTGFGFRPFGTVGRLDASPNSIPHDMRKNILGSDCVVLAATNRYFQRDIHDSSKTGYGMSEMLHTELGMAYASGRPILAFVLDGTGVGSFLPQCVQYVPIRPNDEKRFRQQFPVIQSYFGNAYAMIKERWRKEQSSELKKVGLGTLAIIGGAAIARSFFTDEEEEDSSES